MSPTIATVFGLNGEDIKQIGAAATAFGVLLALFGPSVTRWWRAPLLSVDYEPVEGDPHWDNVSMPDGTFFLRLRVRNARGCDAARDAEVIVAGFRGGAIGLDERSLEWSGVRPPGKDPVTKIDLAPGLSRHVDLVQVTQGFEITLPQGERRVDAQARLCVFPKPWGKAHVIHPSPSPCPLTLVVVAANTDALIYETSIRYDGSQVMLLRSPQSAGSPLRHRLRQRIKRC